MASLPDGQRMAACSARGHFGNDDVTLGERKRPATFRSPTAPDGVDQHKHTIPDALIPEQKSDPDAERTLGESASREALGCPRLRMGDFERTL